MPYRYLQDIAIADVAFAAWGETPEKMFLAAAEALMNVMIDNPARIANEESVEVVLEDAELDLLLFRFLNEFVYYKDARLLLLRVASLFIDRSDGLFSLQARLSGETIDPQRHHMNVDVKAVTLHRFRVEETARGWESTVILDI